MHLGEKPSVGGVSAEQASSATSDEDDGDFQKACVLVHAHKD